jgi:hypothetical protein
MHSSTRKTIIYALGMFMALSLSRSYFAAPAADLKAGVAVAGFTPPVGWRMSGYFNERLRSARLRCVAHLLARACCGTIWQRPA